MMMRHPDERESDTVMSVIDGDKPDHNDDTDPDDEPPPRGGRPHSRCEINKQARRACFAFGPFSPPSNFLCYDELFSFNGTGLQ